MLKNICCLLIIITTVQYNATAQKIIYSEADRDDQKSLNFDIIGKINNHILVYKNNRNDHSIAVFDNEMKQVEKVNLDFLPDRVISTDVLN